MNKLFKPKSNEELNEGLKSLDDSRLFILSARIGYKKGVEISLKNKDLMCHKISAFNQAIMTNQIEIVKLLIDNGTAIHTSANFAIRHASGNGYDEIVKLLIEAGVDIHANLEESLKFACVRGYHKVVKLLVEAGADTSKLGPSYLEHAFNSGFYEINKILKYNENTRFFKQNN